MRATDDYLALIPPLNANKAAFVATIAASVASFADAQSFLANLSQAFDIDVAIGAQLDVVGQWVGQSRNIAVPVVQPWFAFDTALRGWGQGFWKGPAQLGDYISALDDPTYRRLLYAKIAANYGNGRVADAQNALNKYFIDPATFVFVVDVTIAVGVIVPFSWAVPNNGWGQSDWRGPGEFLNVTQPTLQTSGMTWEIGVSGKLPSVVDLEVLAQNLIPVTPAGVTLDIFVVTVDNTALFGWGLENQYVCGWGVGSWGAPPDFVALNVL